jgi:hypothetical protein
MTVDLRKMQIGTKYKTRKGMMFIAANVFHDPCTGVTYAHQIDGLTYTVSGRFDIQKETIEILLRL